MQARSVNTQSSNQSFSKTIEALHKVQMTPKPKAAPKVDSPALYKAKFKGLELQHQLNQDAYNQWNHDMAAHFRHADLVSHEEALGLAPPPVSPVRPSTVPAEHSTPTQRRLAELSHRMSGVTTQFCNDEGRELNFYPLAVAEGMKEIQEKLSGISLSSESRAHNGALSAPESSREEVRAETMMCTATNKVSELMALLESESAERAASRAASRANSPRVPHVLGH